MEHGEPIKSSIRIRWRQTPGGLKPRWRLLVMNSVACLLLSASVRNKRSAQADRLSAITMALQYESDEEGILSGTSPPHHRRNTRIHRALIKTLCAVNCCYWWACRFLTISPFNPQGLSTMMKGNPRQRVWPPTWTWPIPSSSCMRQCGGPGTARANWSLSLSCSCPPGRTTQTTTTRSVNPSACIRSSMTPLCPHGALHNIKFCRHLSYLSGLATWIWHSFNTLSLQITGDNLLETRTFRAAWRLEWSLFSAIVHIGLQWRKNAGYPSFIKDFHSDLAYSLLLPCFYSHYVTVLFTTRIFVAFFSISEAFMFPFNITEKWNESQFTHPSLMETRSAPASSLLFLFVSSSLTRVTDILSLFFFFLFSTPAASHTLTVQYSISVPSFPNVRARNSPQEQDEEQRIWDRRARRLRSDAHVRECQTLQCSPLVHLQACAQTPAHPAGQSRCTGVPIVVVLGGFRAVWLVCACIWWSV